MKALRWALPAAVALLALLLGLRLQRDAAVATAAAGSSRPAAPASAPVAPAADEPARAASATAAAVAASAPRFADVCGVGRVPLLPESPDNEPALPPALGRHALDDAWRQTIDALAAGTPRQRTAAALLRMAKQPPDATLAAALQQQAERSGDGVAAFWALAGCNSGTDRAPCFEPAVERWARFDAGNAAALALRAGETPEALEAALPAIARAARWDTHFGTFSAIATEAAPGHLLPHVRHLMTIEAIGIEAAFAWPAYAGLVKLCRPPVLDLPGRRDDCDALARLLVERSDSLLSFSIGRRLGEFVGWPADELAALKAERTRLEGGDSPILNDRQPLSCAAIDADSVYLRDLGAHGELHAMRRRAERRAAPAN